MFLKEITIVSKYLYPRPHSTELEPVGVEPRHQYLEIIVLRSLYRARTR